MNKSHLFSIVIFLLGSLVHSENKEVLIFHDDFNSFNLMTWKHELTMGGNGNREFQQYVNSRKNTFVQDGKLFIHPTLTEDTVGSKALYHGVMDIWGNTPADQCTGQQFFGCFRDTKHTKILNPTQSARLRTAESFSFKFGRVEISAKLPKGDWLLPGISLAPMYESYGKWPSSGEINILQGRGNNVSYRSETHGDMGYNSVSSSFHFGTKWNKDGSSTAFNQGKVLPDNDTFADEFHTFGLYWDDKEIYTYLDTPENKLSQIEYYGKKSFFDVGVENDLWKETSFNPYEYADKIAPFDQEMYLILNLAVGGTSRGEPKSGGFFPDGVGNKPWNNTDYFPAYNFYNAKDTWYPSWSNNGNKLASAFQIGSVKVWGFEGLSTWSNHNNPSYVVEHPDRICKNGSFGNCYDSATGICYQNVPNSKKCYNSTTSLVKEQKEKKDIEEVILFQEDFDDFVLRRWKHDISMSSSINNDDKQFQLFLNSRKTSYVKNGALYITPSLSSDTYGTRAIMSGRVSVWGSTISTLCSGNKHFGCDKSAVHGNVVNPIASAHIRSSDSFSFRFGRVEIRAKLPRGDWLMPYFRLVPLENHYGGWPLSGSIDILTSRGNSAHYKSKDGKSLGIDSYSSCIHYGKYYNIECNSTALQKNETFANEFHTFGLYWDDNELFTYIDDIKNVVYRVEDYGSSNFAKKTELSSPVAPFDQEMYLSLSVVAGGSDYVFPENVGEKPWNSTEIHPAASFVKSQDKWLPSWNSSGSQESNSFIVDSIKVFGIPGKSKFTYDSNQAIPESVATPSSATSRSLRETERSDKKEVESDEKSNLRTNDKKKINLHENDLAQVPTDKNSTKEHNVAVPQDHVSKKEKELDSDDDSSSSAPKRLGEKKNDKYNEILVFSDDFSQGLDLSKWKPVIGMGGGGNREFQVYTNDRRNLFVKENKLHIKPTLTSDVIGDWMVANGTWDIWGNSPSSQCSGHDNDGCMKYANGRSIINPAQSARIRTSESFSFTYGRVEIRAKLPQGDWLWPGLWLMPLDDSYGTWPSSGEIDLMESRGNAPTYRKESGHPMGRNIFASNAHFGPAWNKNGFPLVVSEGEERPDNDTYADDFHTFGFFWDDERMYTYLDDVDNVVMDVEDYGKKSFWQMGVDADFWNESDSFNPYAYASKNAPFDQAMYLILNVAVGGTAGGGPNPRGFYPDNIGNKPWKQQEPYPAKSFYDRVDDWYPTWTNNGDQVSDSAALQIDSVKIYAFESKSKWDFHRLSGGKNIVDEIKTSRNLNLNLKKIMPTSYSGSIFNMSEGEENLNVHSIVLSLVSGDLDIKSSFESEDWFIQSVLDICRELRIPYIHVVGVHLAEDSIAATFQMHLPKALNMELMETKFRDHETLNIKSFSTLLDNTIQFHLEESKEGFLSKSWLKYLVIGLVVVIVGMIAAKLCLGQRRKNGYQEI